MDPFHNYNTAVSFGLGIEEKDIPQYDIEFSNSDDSFSQKLRIGYLIN